MRPPFVASPSGSLEPGAGDLACDLCGRIERAPYRPETGLCLARCQGCGLVSASTLPTRAQIIATYGERYFRSGDSATVGYVDYIGDEQLTRRTFARRLLRLERRMHPGRLLDVGCATGFLVDEARGRGWAAHGLDISSYAIEYARRRFGCDFREGTMDEAGDSSAFDLITLWDVIEHMPHPTANLLRAAGLLRRGGILSITTPDIESLPSRLARGRWIGYKLSLEHLYYFSRHTILQALRVAGFRVIEIGHVGKYVSVDFFCDRLGRYIPRLGGALGTAARALGVANRTMYADPLDILWVVAVKE